MLKGIDVKIVEYGSKDYETAVVLRDLVLRKPLGLQFSKADLAAEKEQIHFTLWLNKQLIACLSLVPGREKRMKMRQVCVHPNFQRKGYGEHLVLASETFAKAQGYVTMYCHAREVAKHFYLRQGYSIEGNAFEEVGIQHFSMHKTLSKHC